MFSDVYKSKANLMNQLSIVILLATLLSTTEPLLRAQAAHSEEHIEDEDAPIFLRFVNLLINDAIFLLDEALGYMKQIGEQQGCNSI